MKRKSRRWFVGWMSGLTASIGLGARRAEAAPPAPRTGSKKAPLLALDLALLAALAEVALPSELGREGAARVARAFRAWADGFKEGAEQLHPYGSAEIALASALPLSVWAQQLTALDESSRRGHDKAFASLGKTERTALVREALQGVRIAGMPSSRSAPHIAVALTSHYFESPEATDLCYQAQIHKNQCRPLVNAPRKPLPLARGRA